jgi:hypothetical protein
VPGPAGKAHFSVARSARPPSLPPS